MKSREIPETNTKIIDFESLHKQKEAKSWIEASGSEQSALYSNLWMKDREIVSEFLQTPEGAGANVPKLHLHPKRATRLFASIFYMRDDVKLAFVEFVISKFGHEILSREYAG